MAWAQWTRKQESKQESKAQNEFPTCWLPDTLALDLEKALVLALAHKRAPADKTAHLHLELHKDVLTGADYCTSWLCQLFAGISERQPADESAQ